MRQRVLLLAFVLLFLFVALPGVALADGFVIVTTDENEEPPRPVPLPTVVKPGPPAPPPRPPVVSRPFLTVKHHRVDVTITDQVAQTRVDQVFVNDTDRELEGMYIFPLPEDAAISNFAMYVDGKRWEGKLLSKEEARRIYEDTVRRRRDPALLEYIGRGAFQAQVYPIPARAERRIQIEYTQVAPRTDDLVRFVYPLSTEKLSAQPLQQLSIHVRISGREAIKAIYSSSHDVALARRGETIAEASYEATNVRPDKDFVLYYSLSASELGASLLTYHPAGEDGYFLLLVAPRSEVQAAQVAAKDVVLVLDTSGSMQGDKIIKAKNALRFVLDRLNAHDRFSLITFNTSVVRFREGLLTVKDREAAHRYVDGLNAAGSTNINGALLEALTVVDPERPTIVIFLTDGLPTTGVVDGGRIVDNVSKAAARSVRLFSFGVGYDVNTTLLDQLAANQRGASAYVKPGENLEEAVSSFYATISRPVLTDLALDFGGIRVADLYPTPLPDLFAGSQLVVVGRYRTSGVSTLTLKGRVNEQNQQFNYSNLSFPQQTSADTAFIARLWATRRIGYLLTHMRLNGSNKESIDEVVSLSLRYGIITPYTSYLVDERQNVFAPGAQQKAGESMRAALPTAPAAPAAGAGAVQESQALRSLRDAPSAAAVSQATQIRTVVDKTFLLTNGVWTDTQYRQGMKAIDVGFGGNDYFALLATRPDWAQYFALGAQVIVVAGDTAWRVGEGDFPPITLPVTPTSVAAPMGTPVVASPPASTDESINIFLRLWQWLLSLFGG